MAGMSRRRGKTQELADAAAIDYWSAYGLRPDVLGETYETVFGLEMG